MAAGLGRDDRGVRRIPHRSAKGVDDMTRKARIERSTKESQVEVSIDLEGSGDTEVSTGVPFFDHMLAQLGKHALFDLRVRAVGDIEVDAHHTVEDVSIVLGQAL